MGLFGGTQDPGPLRGVQDQSKECFNHVRASVHVFHLISETVRVRRRVPLVLQTPYDPGVVLKRKNAYFLAKGLFRFL